MENFIYGRNAVTELLSDGKRSVSRILILKTAHNNPKIDKIIELAKDKRIVFQFLDKDKFIKYSDYPHQGVIAFVSPVKFTDFETFISKKSKNQFKRAVITDGIEDPNNMGSIIRTAVCAGFDAVIFPLRRNSSITPAVEKASAGAVNYIDLVAVSSLAPIIDKLKNSGFWTIAADIRAKDNYYGIDYCGMNFALIIGSEQKGISSSILKQADYKVKIPMAAGFNSLNAANAASILMYESVKQIMQKSSNVV